MLNNEVEQRFPLKVVALSNNSKTGPIATTYRPVGPTCPLTCQFLNNGCYAQRHVTGIHSRKSASDYHDLTRSLARGVRIIRHQVSGDCFDNDKLDTEYVQYLIDFHKSHPYMNGYMYTHRIADFIEAGFTHDSFPRNLRVIASADNDEVMATAKAAGFQYTRVAATFDEALEGRADDEVVCPNQLSAEYGKRVITCSECRLCIDRDNRPGVVFVKH